MVTAMALKGADVFEDLSVIDCDGHFTEPPDLWTSRATGAMRARLPQLRTIDGITAWFLGDALWSGIGGNTIRAGREKVLGKATIQPYEDIDKSLWSCSERLSLLDEM